MSDTDATGFAKFVPGFDFLQTLAKGASASVNQMPNMGNWIAPTLSVEELDKRIGELKNVQFWLEQNSRALSATVQALEVQRMTLATLKGMNFNLSEVASAFGAKAAETPASPPPKAAEKAASAAKPADEEPTASAEPDKSAAKATAASMVDPLQLWGSLTQQFQQIASNAMQEVTAKAGIDLAKTMAAASAKEPVKPAPVARKKAPAKKTAARKTAARKTTGR
jgi:hypothetical protein